MDRAIVKKKNAKLKTSEGSTQQERETTKAFSTWAGRRGIANAKMQGEMRRLAAARPASAVRKESGSISSQNVTRRHDDDDTCESKIKKKSWGGRFATLSIERSKYQHVQRIPREPSTLLEHLERGQRKTSTLRIDAGRRCRATA
jgi:hypothetical protein